ncbi:hypothetical protein E4582_04885 [Luteimonas yindakuii]|uniref:Uncharacterized protein n=1 Tax=Luteimonas yindakuii TaxID=2565782 RepID=A0A4Z1RKP4_9GAMM|nr:hypothetical protein [Luteimonas yindakuii]TKS54171.1 hypothetical protein E4582_04885 [Luteimonas yindakuii]
MNTRDPSPLDADERALAAQLARHAPAGGPAPDLDARVLAAARAATGTHPASSPTQHARHATRPRRRRWPALTGLAASVALAAGIAWQLRPQPAPAPVQDEAAALPAAAFRAPPEARALPAPAAETAAAGAGVAAGPELADAPATPAVEATVTQPVDAAVDAVPPAGAADDGGSEPAPAAALAPSAPVPAPFATAAPARDDDTTSPRPMAKTPGPTAVGRQAMRGTAVPLRTAVAAAEADSGMHADMHPQGFGDEELDDSPPATVDSPEVHRAWLARIRELRDSGRTDDARESLAELRRRFPGLPIPDDLAALAEPAQ